MSTYYDEYRNAYYNPDDVEEQPGDNQNWRMIQKGFDNVEYMNKPAASAHYNNTSSITIESGKSVVLTFAAPAAVLSLPVKAYYVRYIAISNKEGIIVGSPYIKIVSGESIQYDYNFLPLTAFSADSVTLNAVLTNYTDEDLTLNRSDLFFSIEFYPMTL